MLRLTVNLKNPHTKQKEFIDSKAKRRIIRAGRRGGKTTGMAIAAVLRFLDKRRVLYAAPTMEQTDAFWQEVKGSLAEPLQAGAFVKNETERTIEVPGTKQRIKAKTAWNADGLRGDYADLLILDEYQLMNEDTWEVVGQPMLLDNDGDAVFIYTPPSLVTPGATKARDPRHAARLFKKAKEDTTGTWAAFHFTSWDNPYTSLSALEGIKKDMSEASYRQEIMAEDDDTQLRWLVYSRFNPESQIIKRFPISAGWPVFVGHDFGTANPCAMFVAQNPSSGEYHVFHEYLPGPGNSTAQHVAEFKRLTQGFNVLRRVGGNATTEEEIRQGYCAHGWYITRPRQSSVSVQIDRFTGLLELNKLFVFEDLRVTLSQLASCMWKLDDEGRVTNEIASESRYHCLAALRYVCSDFTRDTERQQKCWIYHGW